MNSIEDKSAGSDKGKRPNLTAIRGFPIDDQTRCKHYHSLLDIVAIKFRCCREYYPCHACHEESAGHAAERWRIDEQSTRAVLCGACGFEMTIEEYLSTPDQCPSCQSAFNPGCRNHHHLYFEI